MTRPPRIDVVDYGAGNLRSVTRALEACGATARVVCDAAALADARAIVIPGVGHFAATRTLDDAWRAAVRDRVAAGAALLGVCLGMQWLFDASDEAPAMTGLGAFVGTCTRLAARPPLKVPHTGWNTLTHTRASRALDGIPDATAMYFTHTYAAPITRDACATTTHGDAFAAVVERDRIAGVQFHPEKSGAAGLRVLRNFVDLAIEAAC
jgi:glutamine amidotransferase